MKAASAIAERIFFIGAFLAIENERPAGETGSARIRPAGRNGGLSDASQKPPGDGVEEVFAAHSGQGGQPQAGNRDPARIE
jgi:hypothetical protein